MTYEITGVFVLSLLITLAIWVSTLVWALVDTIRSKKPMKWILISLIPLAGPLIYYLYSSAGKKTTKLFGLFKSRWVIVALIFIMVLGFYVRLVDYRWPYLRNIDSYVFYRSMDEIVLNNGVLPVHDVYQLAPYGFDRPLQHIYPYFYMGAYSYMLTRMFVPMLTLVEYLIYFPPFLAILAAIPLYFIGKMLFDRKAGVIAAFIYTFDVSNLSRSLGGDPDSDAIVILVSMVTMAFLILTYKYASSAKAWDKKLILYSTLTAVVLWLWYSTWAGYWYIFWLFLGFIILRFLISVLKKRKLRPAWLDTKFILLSFAFCIVLSFALTVPLYGGNKIFAAITGPIQFQSIKGEDTQFPNVYVSVAELQQSGGPKEIIERTSVVTGPLIVISPFFLMIYALAYLIYSYYKTGRHIDTVLLLLIWFIGPFSATIIAVRFSVLFSAPLAIGSAILFSKIIRMSTGEDRSFSD